MANSNIGVRLHGALLTESKEKIHEPQPKLRGRSAELISKRNEALFYRFYFKTKLEKKFYNEVVAELQTEFYISCIMIQKLLQANSDRILALKKEALTGTILKKKFPYLNW